MKYADYYRHAKIQETVFEMLTQQYELAKVEEAKEIPSVKVLDPGTIPEKKSYPSAIFVILVGTLLVFAFAVVWVLGSANWEEVDPKDPRKVFAQEVACAVKAHVSGLGKKATALVRGVQRVWNRLGRRRPATGRWISREGCKRKNSKRLGHILPCK